ncbi:MAG TPA: tetratricopeptide repeat protein [Casimicrobiaceae bacterium]|nr:tetratricopeptide repeat protein [Casimicrobiaceae bacterium]
MTLRTLSIVLLLAVAAAAGADPGSYANRDEAVRAAESPNADTRAEALAWIAGHGTQADAAILKEHLTDDNVYVRNIAEQSLWTLWSRSGDDAVDGLLAAGTEQMRTGDLDGAIATFSTVITQKPEFAEGWNKRATALFLAGEFRRSLADCDEVMKRNPLHFGALAGYGQIYFQLEQYERAIAYWKRALEVNPNLSGVETSIRATEQLLAERRRRGA